MNRAARLSPVHWLLLVLPLVACTSHPQRNPTLDELRQATAADEAERAGDWLMDRPLGLNGLDTRPTDAPLIAVHGYGSEGREWVGPLGTLDAAGTTWFRWDWMTCPDKGAAKLAAAIDEVAARPGITRIIVVGHSYGGLISGLMAHRYAGPVPLEVHTVAAPLAGVPRMNRLCGAVKPGEAGAGQAQITQWRTVHAQDGAFKDLEIDPQVVDWAGDEVVALPAEWDGGRLGHNRSLSWVAAELVKRWGANAPADEASDTEPAMGGQAESAGGDVRAEPAAAP